MFYKLSTNLCFHYTTHAYFCQYLKHTSLYFVNIDITMYMV